MLRQRLIFSSAENHGPFLFHMIHYELPELVDYGDGIHIAFPLRATPREKAMTTKNDSITLRIVPHRFAQHHAELEARTLPREPDKLVFKLTIEFVHLLVPVGRSRERNAPVRMQMIYVFEGEKTVQRRIN